MLCACSGSDAAGDDPPANVTVAGRITFDRIPFKSSGAGLDPTAPIVSPAREVTVEAIDAGSSSILASTSTDADGAYSLSVPAERRIIVRAKAEMLRTGAAPTWSFSVRDNTSADALYALVGSAFDTGTDDITRNLHAPSGWEVTGYMGERAAAPFAILDTVYEAKELVRSAAGSTSFPPLNLYWSADNRNVANEFCPREGAIATSFYIGLDAPDLCTPAGVVKPGIYILGAFDGPGGGDTDEFDAHVLAHEFGHYIEDQLSRSDSLGGEHQSGDRLDMRLAFSEGWGNAYSAMSLGDPIYRDSLQGVSNEFGFDLETAVPDAAGWYSEFSVGEFLWDVFDGGAQDDDPVTLGFGPIFEVMTGAQRTTDALTSIFSFASALRTNNPAVATALRDLLAQNSVNGTDAYGTGESHDGGSQTALPIYTPIELNRQSDVLCTSARYGDQVKLGYRRFLRLTLGADATVAIQVNGAPDPLDPTSAGAIDPDVYVHRRGVIVARGESPVESSELIDQLALEAGTYIIEVLDFALPSGETTRHCMTVSVTGM